MDALNLLSIVAIVLGGTVLLGAALHDVAARTVPNGACLAVAGAGLVARVADGTVLNALLAALLVFVAAAICWRRGYMGGGDVKLFGAVALLVPPAGVLPMVCATALFGAVLTLPYLVARGRMRRGVPGRPPSLVPRVLRAERWRLRRGGPLPYAVAIACGTFYVLSSGASS